MWRGESSLLLHLRARQLKLGDTIPVHLLLEIGGSQDAMRVAETRVQD